MGKAKLCGVLSDLRGSFVDDNKVNATGKHGIRINPDGTHSIVQYGRRDYVKNPETDREKEIKSMFTQASQLRSMILQDASLKATWAARFKLDTTTKCNTLSGYIQSMAAKGHVDSDGAYK